MFNFIKTNLTRLYETFTVGLSKLLSRNTVDRDTLNELKIVLLQADTGVETTRAIIDQLKEQHDSNNSLSVTMEALLCAILEKPQPYAYENNITLLVGVNGTGKTTSAGKLAHMYKQRGEKVLIAACDTFRAAAVEQLKSWADELGVDIVIGKQGQDPASVVYAACTQFVEGGYTKLIIDTAGRLQTKVNLMNELNKMYRVIQKKLPDTSINTLLTIDGMLGQNSLEQARLFKGAAQVNGVILTKMDGTGKGGIVFALANQLDLPVAYLTYGETVDAIKSFDSTQYVRELLG